MTNLAENLATTTSQGDLARELQRLRDAEGVTFAAIANKTVTYDFERLMEGATLRSCSQFAQDMIDQM